MWARVAVDVRQFSLDLRRQMEPLFGFLKELGAQERQYQRVYDAGWLPHHTTPLQLISEDADPQRIRELLRAHYAADWEQVRADFEAELAKYDLDCEAKDCFREALDAHEGRRYRAPPKLLFPEIERVVREELYNGSVAEALTSQHELRAAAGTLTPFELGKNSVGGLRLYRKFEEHLYAHVKTPDEIAHARADPVPNRHASLHGVVVYSSMQSSLNALIMTDFVFAIVNALKPRGANWRKP
jgi:hypothetical protein